MGRRQVWGRHRFSALSLNLRPMMSFHQTFRYHHQSQTPTRMAWENYPCYVMIYFFCRLTVYQPHTSHYLSPWKILLEKLEAKDAVELQTNAMTQRYGKIPRCLYVVTAVVEHCPFAAVTATASHLLCSSFGGEKWHLQHGQLASVLFPIHFSGEAPLTWKLTAQTYPVLASHVVAS
jgi:hypothetical protein